MMVVGSWCLRGIGEPSSTTKSLQDDKQGGGVDAPATGGGENDNSSGAAGGGGGCQAVDASGAYQPSPTRALEAAAVDYNNMVVGHQQQQPAPQENNTATGNATMRRNAGIFTPSSRETSRLYRPKINTTTTTTSGAVAAAADAPQSPKGQAAQPPGYAGRWNEPINPHRIHTNRPSTSSNNNDTSPLAAERRSRLLQRHVLNRHGRNNNSSGVGMAAGGGPPVGTVTTTTAQQQYQQQTASSQQQQQRRPLHLQSHDEQHVTIEKAQHEDDKLEQLVCDYDTSATVLYELLESSNWEEARNRCRSHPDEVRTWIVRKDKSLKVRWKLLPLHAAIIFQCPNFIVAALLDKHPAAISSVDDQGMLPLHLAFRHKHEDEDLLELLLVHYPQAVLVKDNRDRVPLEHGRDCKFSAKFTRLYADAITAGSRAQNNSGGGDPATVDNNNNNNNHMSPRHGDQVTAKTTMNTSFRMDACGTGACTTTASDQDEVVFQQRASQWRIPVQQQRQHDAELLRIREQYEGQIKQLREQHKQESHEQAVVAKDERHSLMEEHKREVGRIREQYEEQMKQLREQHKQESHEQAVVAKDERHSLMEEHKREVADLRAVVSKQNGRENSMIRDLQTQISELQRSLESSQWDRDQFATQCERLEAFHAQVKLQMYDIVQDQVAIRDLVLQQERDLESARQMRSQIVRTLMQQEDTDGENDRVTTEKVMQMGESVRGRIQTLLDNDPMANSKNGTAEPKSNLLASKSASVGVAPAPPPPKALPAVQKTSKLQQNANARRYKLQMRGPSRVEMERNNNGGEEEVELIDTRQTRQEERKSYHHQHAHQHNHHSGHHHHSNNNRYDRMGGNRLQPESRQDFNDRAADGDSSDDALREAKSLGDDISAITEVSP